MQKYPKQRELKLERGVLQGCILSPVLFNGYPDHAISRLQSKPGGGHVSDTVLNRILFADDTVPLATSEKALQALVDQVHEIGKAYTTELVLRKRCL